MTALLIGIEYTDQIDNWPQCHVAVFETVERAQKYLEDSKQDTYDDDPDFTTPTELQFRHGSLLWEFSDAFVKDLSTLPQNPEFIETPPPERKIPSARAVGLFNALLVGLHMCPKDQSSADTNFSSLVDISLPELYEVNRPTC